MEKSFAFNSVNGDRRYKAEDFREYFASFIGNGVFPNTSTNLQVIANSNMTITIKQGKAWINGAIYINTDDYIVPIVNADGVLNRIDRVVLRMDTAERKIYSYVKKGTFSSTPVAPTLQRDADAYELALADVKVDKGTISITQANITDLRQNKNYCGIVHGTVEQIDVTTLFNQYATKLEEKELGFEEDFKQWFETVKGQLSGDVAGNLAIQIEANKKKIEGVETNVKSQLENITKEQEKVFQSVSNGKACVASAITDKGVTTLANDTFSVMANNISKIKVGYGAGDNIPLNKLQVNYKADSEAYLRSYDKAVPAVYSIRNFIPTMNENELFINYTSTYSYKSILEIYTIKNNKLTTLCSVKKSDIYHDFCDNYIYGTYYDWDEKKSYIRKYDFNGKLIFSINPKYSYCNILIDKFNNNLYALRYTTSNNDKIITHIDKLNPATGALILSLTVNSNITKLLSKDVLLIYNNKLYYNKFKYKYDINNINNAPIENKTLPSDINKVLYEKERNIFLLTRSNNNLIEYNFYTDTYKEYRNINEIYNNIYINKNKEYAYLIPLASDGYTWNKDIVKYSLKQQKKIYKKEVAYKFQFGSTPSFIYSLEAGEIYVFHFGNGSDYNYIQKDRIVEEKIIESISILN
ncbi:hypothetical protein [Clostridium ihumii]|uniref:hypothetical protein n=1 Tax=Clostridium ihumii TaxID=1470356 RepID=UPI003D33A643